jgi:nucleoside-diphosphate kinase
MSFTYAMIKPDGVQNGHIGHITSMIEENGFKIVKMKLFTFTKEQAEKFYEVHAERPFYGELTDMMSGTPLVGFLLEKDDAVNAWRELIGATDPAEAAAGTVRALYGVNKGENTVHGSDSDENAKIEADYVFSL